MKGATGKILYVGKASNLRSRVLSYFHPTDPKTIALMRKVVQIEKILTATSYEALLLEINLIKQWKPPYNIDLRDGKSYALIRVTNEDYPQVFVTRRIVRDGSHYYGPYVKVGQTSRLMELIERHYPLRRCRGAIRVRSHPCLYYHIQQCAAPCSGKIDRAKYRTRVRHIQNILAGNTKSLERHLEHTLQEQSNQHQYELAQRSRDQLLALRALRKDAPPLEIGGATRDYIGYARDQQRVIFALFQSRDGTLIGSYQFESDQPGEVSDRLTEFIIQFYDNRQQLPQSIVIAHREVGEELMRYYRQQRAHSIWIGTPQKPRDHTLLRLAQRNANAELYSHYSTPQKPDALIELAHDLNLSQRPRHIEGFDIAHVGGAHTVAAMVLFQDGEADRSSYRRYRLRSLKGAIDDFEAMREVIARRYSRLKNEQLPIPDLIVVDGGIGQVNAAYSILSTLDLQYVALIGIAKKREELYLPGNSSPITLPYDSTALRLIQQIRDEAHRFATAYRSQRQLASLDNNQLLAIKGIGTTRAKMLLKRYHSLEAIAAMDWRQLARETTLGATVAQAVARHLHTHLQSSGQKNEESAVPDPDGDKPQSSPTG